ncbi:ABC transporter permease subunit [Paenibacillus donghaensis]|uniref:Uncharacterized protein n=1 Tax=Paenibacillus donghaensis TaxID=414771 RepID=A0A2Z2KVW5_9BACL|nr:ABC transporter permease subunit [Paenibacillus donghaensis]ASA24118.1 hypothetical protein B9T62_27035 [Paenibacillus donghaensis]
MNLLTRFEFQKILRRKTTLAGIGCMLLFTLLSVYLSVHGVQWTDEKGDDLNGKAGISLKRQQTHELAGNLDPVKISMVLERYQKADNDPDNQVPSPDGNGMVLSNEAYGKFIARDSAITNLIRSVFSPVDGYDYYVIDSMTAEEAAGFYEVRRDKIKQRLNMDYTYGNYTEADKAYFLEKNDKLAVPFKFDYAEGWEKVLQNLSALGMVAAFVISLSLAPMFAGEYQSGADSLILSSRYGQTKLIMAKLRAGILFTTGFFWITNLILLVLTLLFFGINGWNSNLQIIAIMSPYGFTLLQTYLLSVLIGYLACLMIMALTLVLSAVMRSPFQVIIVTAAVLIVPMFIPDSKRSRLFNHMMSLLPSNMLEGYTSFTTNEVYHMFGQLVPQPYVIAGTAVVFTLLLLPVAYRRFSTHQVA